MIRFTASDYAAALRALFPRGRVWPAEADSQQSVAIAAIAEDLEQLDADANDLLADSFPASAVHLLPEWEETLGLPDPCLGDFPTIAQRQAQVVARLIGAGGQSKQFFIDFAAKLGFVIEISEFAPSRIGRIRCGNHLAGADWAHTWLVTVISGDGGVLLAAFRTGVGRMGDHLASDAVTYPVLECELKALKPAHTQIFFATP